MIFFYKNYNEYSRLATFFSMMGGIFYAFAVVSVIIGASDESMGIGGGLAMAAVMVILGLGNNAFAKAIAKSKGAPIGDDKKNDNASEKNVVEAENYVVEDSAKTEPEVQKVVKSEPVVEKAATKAEEAAEPEAVLVGGVQESMDNLETLKAKEEHKVQSQNEWRCTYCGTLNTGKFCCECGKERVVAKFCPNCGEKLREGQKFCSNCGSKIG